MSHLLELPSRTPRGAKRSCALALITAAIMLIGHGPADKAFGQGRPRRPRPLNQQAVRSTGSTITINYPDSVDLASFVDYVSQSLDIKIIYGDELGNRSVIFRPGQVDVPRDQLLNLLRGMLRMHDLTLIEGDIEGWHQIVQADEFHRHVKEIRTDQSGELDAKANRVVTQIVKIQSADPSNIVKNVQKFLSSPRASIIEIPEKGMLIVTDYESGLLRALEIIELLDSAPVAADVAVVGAKFHEAAAIAEYVTGILTEQARLENRPPIDVAIQASLAGESLILIGTPENVSEVRNLIERFDVPPENVPTTVVYAPKHISVTRFQHLVENVIKPTPAHESDLRLLADEDRNRLYATAVPSFHDKIAALLADEDVPLEKQSRPTRIYKPRNRSAADLISILSEVLPNITVSLDEGLVESEAEMEKPVPPGRNRPPAQAGVTREPPIPPAEQPITEEALPEPKVKRIAGSDFVLTYDEHTNSLIAIGSREFHDRLSSLLLELDKRQSQVMIEVTLVAITFNDSLSVAVELANEELHNDTQSLLFSSFGISDIDLGTGARTLNPGGGLNAIIIGPHETPIVFRAIAAHGNSRVVSTPRVLVANNTSATISSVEEAPFTSLNASDTVATTSFAGFESAGTSLTVTPSVIETEHLALNYSFNFSNFTGQGSVGVPPPRTTNSFSGKIEIPDGHTAVIGGLVTENESDNVTEVPLLGRIPILGAAFQSSDRIRTKSRIYAFIRPTILRDDEFKDLKLITQADIEKAEIANKDYPTSAPLLMR